VVGRVVTEVGSALNERRRQFLALLRDQTVTTIVVEHRDRFARFGAEYRFGSTWSQAAGSGPVRGG
jgi:predicted site-specific integrase-resolvase